MNIAGFKKLQIWQRAIQLTVKIYQLTENLPDAEKFGLISQMRRCAVSVPSNIAEGYGRYSDQELAHFLRIARGSLYELVTQCTLCCMLGYINEDLTKEIDKEAEEIDKMTISFINKLEGHFK